MKFEDIDDTVLNKFLKDFVKEKNVEDLSIDELLHAAKRANQVGGYISLPFHFTLRAWQLDATRPDVREAAAFHGKNFIYSSEDRHAELDKLIEKGIGPVAEWHLMKADKHIESAWNVHGIDYHWLPAFGIALPHYLEKAAEEISKALSIDPSVQKSEYWNKRFAALF